VRAEITNSTAYFQAPFTWGTPLTEAPPPAPEATAPPPAPAAESATTTTAPGSESGSGKKVPGGGSSSGSGSGPGGSGAAGTSHSASTGNGNDLSKATQASAVSIAGDASSRGVRVFVAAIIGALCGARILAVVSRTRRRGLETA
jgi:hypothetical protein